MEKFEKIMLSFLICMFLLSPVRFIENTDSWLIDIISHFPVQYAFAAAISLILCIWKKAFRLGIMAVILFIFNISSIAKPVKLIEAGGHSGETFKVYSANLHIKNHDLSKLKHEMKNMSPEMALLLEVTPEHFSNLRQVIKSYPYSIEKSWDGKEEIGFVLLSKFPIKHFNIVRLSNVCNFVLEAELEINQKPLKFYGIHAQRPGIKSFAERRDQFIELSQRIKNESLPVIVAGDFNATPFSPTIRQMLETSGLRDSGAGFGWQPSWPTYAPVLWIPIDQILLSQDLQVYNSGTGSYIGSDHYPVFAEVSLNN